MSTSAPFKQTCPSCGGVITVKNQELVGKRIDCPKCKTRILIHLPGAAAEPKGKGSKAAGARGKAPGSAGTTDEAATSDSGKKKKKKKTSPKPMYVLAGLGVVVLLIVGVVLLMQSGGEPVPSPPLTLRTDPKPPPLKPTLPTSPVVDLLEKEIAALINDLGDAKRGAAARQLLVARINTAETPAEQLASRTIIRRLLEAAKKRRGGTPQEVLEEAHKAATRDDVRKEVAKAIADLRRDLAQEHAAWSDDPTNQIPSNANAVLHVRMAELSRGPLGEAMFAAGAFRSRDFESSLGLALGDIEQLLVSAVTEHGQCLVIVRTPPILEREWHKVKAALKLSDETKVVAGTEYYLGSVSFLNEFLEPRFPVASLRRSAAVVRKNERTLIYGTPALVERFLESPPTPNPSWLRKTPPDPKKPATDPFAVTYRTYLTVSEDFRRLIEQVERDAPRSMLFYAEMGAPGRQKTLPVLSDWGAPFPREMADCAAELLRIDGLALALDAAFDRPITLRAALACGDEKGRDAVHSAVEKLFKRLAAGPFKQFFGTEVSVGGPAPPPPPPPEPKKPDPVTGDVQPTEPVKPVEPAPPPPPTSLASITLERFPDRFVTVVFTFHGNQEEWIDRQLAPEFVYMRGQMDMLSRPFRVREFADSFAPLLQSSQNVFPHGAYPRPPAPEHSPRDLYRGDQRVSWMAGLLPYLGDDRYAELHGRIDTSKSWSDPQNLKIAQVLVPHFLNPQSGEFYSHRTIDGVQRRVANTHFVGMSGVGPDAMFYPKAHPYAGIFGDPTARGSPTSVTDVKDGLSHTILAIQNDPSLFGPWMQGGGASMRGTSRHGVDIGEAGGFRSPAPTAGREGAWVLMADGSVRFLRKGISPDVFRALATMAGGDNDLIGNLEKQAPALSRDGVLAPQPPVEEKPPEKTQQLPSQGGTWHPHTSLLPRLTKDEYAIGDEYLIRYPSGYQPRASVDGMDRLVSWFGPKQAKRSAPELHLTVFKRSQAELKLRHEEAFDLAIRRLREESEVNWVNSPPENGMINGLPFTRCRLVAMEGGKPVARGVYYLYLLGERGIAFFMFDIVPGDQVSLEIMETAVLTFRRK